MDQTEATGDVSAEKSSGQFEVGDVVCLKGGSPLMTVVCVTPPDEHQMDGSHDVISVVWFDEQKMENEDFPPSCLRKCTRATKDDEPYY